MRELFLFNRLKKYGAVSKIENVKENSIHYV